MTSKPPNLVERAAAQLLKSGNPDNAAAQLLGQSAVARPAGEAAETAPAQAPAARAPSEAPSGVQPGSPTALQGLANLATPAGTMPPASAPPRETGVVTAPVSATPTALETNPAAIVDTTAAPAVIGGADRSIDLSALERAGMIDWNQARSRISEEFRIVQRQVLRNASAPEIVEQGHANLIMLTSARPGEGKSFVALNLASGIARQRDHDVLLVDIDYKHDSIGTALGLSGGRGLLDLVTDPSLDPDEVIVKTGLKNLSILPIGQHAERSPELFASRQATRLIQSLGRRYADRLVILDAPPCLATSEPGVLASVVGQVVMVVEAEKTQREEVEAAMDIVHACPTITLLLNKVQVASRYSFGAYASSYAQPYTS